MRKRIIVVLAMVVIATLAVSPGTGQASSSEADIAAKCEALYGDVFGSPNSEPFGPCQWDMSIINAGGAGSYGVATGAGVTVGVIDSGVDFSHPDIEPNLEVDLSCSFIARNDENLRERAGNVTSAAKCPETTADIEEAPYH